MTNRVLIFLHIPKTAGTTLRQVITRQYPEDVIHTLTQGEKSIELLRGMPDVEKAKIQVVLGHTKFGFHTSLGLRADYITMLREPVGRVISHYYWIKSTPGHDLHPEVSKMRLEDFATSGLPHATNQQTEFTSGMTDPQNETTLEVARNNIAVHFKAVGLVEYFDLSLLFFKKVLGWRNICYFDRNVATLRPRRDEIPPSTIELIRRNNGPDVELYEFAKSRLEEFVEQHGTWFRYQLRSFRLKNRMYRRFARNDEALEGSGD